MAEMYRLLVGSSAAQSMLPQSAGEGPDNLGLGLAAGPRFPNAQMEGATIRYRQVPAGRRLDTG
jgi:hypothetical protein